MPHARDSRGCIRGKLTITGCVWSDHGGVHCACKCQGLSTLSSSSTADDDEGAVRPQADEDGARMATAGGRLHLATAGGRLHLVEDDLSQEV